MKRIHILLSLVMAILTRKKPGLTNSKGWLGSYMPKIILKKSLDSLGKEAGIKSGDKFVIISNCSDSVSLKSATESLDASRSGYYKWLNYSKWHNRQDNYNITLGDEIQKIAIEFTGYGYRRITAELHNRNFQVNHKKVNRIMKEDNLMSILIYPSLHANQNLKRTPFT
ncbi:MAG: hypothetical protein AEth_00261 [Candidatus Argoarchaeum ethanivorans]|uniref:HTH-like domain-containing protein n=1 Tax=Candidatus Argoarchaeum ethanivorans TaxID=2608793 RepID=A0A8B6SDK0_9EURY|nr:MAG: hypothetical protein AEth_00261 [Candidatus Argoarchaeum ethanivorans]